MNGFSDQDRALFRRLVDESGARQDDLLFGRYKFAFECRGGEWRMSSLRFLMHGAQRFKATDAGGSPFYADGLDPSHPQFSR